MLKLVHSFKKGYTRSVLRRLRLYHPSLQRLKELSEGNGDLPARSEEFSELLDDLLINGVWKKTGAGRLGELDLWVNLTLPEPLPSEINFLDVGGSDGSTTHDTVRYFREDLGIAAKATILEMQVRIRCYQRWPIRYYLTHDQQPLLLQLGNVGILFEEINAKEGLLFNPLIRKTRKYLRHSSLSRHLRDCGDLFLINPKVKEDSSIDWLEKDLFQFEETLAGSFDYVRCCNILNRGYFSDSRINDAVQLLARYLKRDGLFLVGRTVCGQSSSLHTASLWMKSDNGLNHLADLNGGSEIKDIVPAYSCTLK